MKPLFWMLFFFPSLLLGTEYAPWFGNVFEFIAEADYGFTRQCRIQSPEGSFPFFDRVHEAEMSLYISPWPQWDLQGEIFYADDRDHPFSLEAVVLTGRYLWLDELLCSPISLATGVTFFLPRKGFLQDLNFWYHGTTNVEFHLALGKEWTSCCDIEKWKSRLWFLAGFGVASRGSPWLHAVGALDCALSNTLQGGLFTEGLFGLGKKDIYQDKPFEGYASIHHQSVDIGLFLKYQLGVFGYATVTSGYTVYAENYPWHTFFMNVSLKVPFSL